MIIHSLSGKNNLMLDLTNGAMSIEKDGITEESSISKGRPVLNKYTLVSIKNTGISNRIKNIVSCFRIIDRLKDLGHTNTNDFKISWSEKWGKMDSDEPWRPPAKFSSLFANKNMETDKISAKALKKGSAIKLGYIPYSTWRLIIFKDDNIPIGFSQNVCNFSPNGQSIDFEYERIPKEIKTEYIKLFKRLILADGIKNRVDSFAKNNFNKNTVSVHIRAWCDPLGVRGINKGIVKFNLNDFISAMKKEDDSKNFFIASDSDDVIDKIKREFGKRIICRDISSKSTEDDLMDLYLLSKNDKIIGTEHSTFTEVAWWLSECSADIYIV